MIGGTIKKPGIALGIAMAGLAFGGTTSASAADLGGGGLADLEERIAELEATTARKGNRKVSLEISGFVNEALFLWDDGFESNAYVTTNEINPTRFRLKGEAKVTDTVKAGYLIELGVNGGRQDRQNQDDDNGTTGSNTVGVRHSAWYLSSKDLGKLWVGQTSDAADGILEINVANTGHFASSNVSQSFGDGGGGFFLRTKGGVLLRNTAAAGDNSISFGDLVVNGWGGTPDSHRYNLVKYETPTIAGFVGSASWGEDDIWNVALRYKGEFSGFQLAAGIGYTEYSDAAGQRRGARSATGHDVDVQEWGIGASIIHTATGIFVTGSYGQDTDNNIATATGGGTTLAQLALSDDETNFYFIQAGIEKKFFPLGKTTVYGEYFNLERGLALGTNGNGLNASQLGTASGLGAGFNRIVSSELQGWGLGLNQSLNDVIDVYVSYRHVDVDVTLANGAGQTATPGLESFDYVTTGAYIKF